MRVHEALLLRQAAWKPTVQQPSQPSRLTQPRIVSGAKYNLCTRTGSFAKVVGGKSTHVLNPISEVALMWFMNEYSGERSCVIPIYTEVTIMGEICRADQNYRGGGPWYDYLRVCLEKTDKNRRPTGETVPSPCRLAAIWYDQGHLMVLLQIGYQLQQASSMLFHRYGMEYEALRTASGTLLHRAVFEKCPLELVNNRICCIDVGAHLDGDPFSRLPGDSTESFDVLWTARTDWASSFLDSPAFLASRPSSPYFTPTRKRRRDS